MLAGGAVSIGLPSLEAFFPTSTAFAADGFPKRFIVWMWGNGNRPETWTPAQTGANYTLGPQLAPLAPMQQKMSLITGLAVKEENLIPHWSGAAGLLTGSGATGTDIDWTIMKPTMDQIVANEIGGSTLYRSLQVGVTTTDCFSFNGPNGQNFGEDNPFALYERLFGSTFVEPGEGGLVDPKLGFRRSALDAVMGDIAKLNSKLGAYDKARLDQHLTGVRELETRLALLESDPPSLASCARPTEPLPDYPNIDGKEQIDAKNRIMAELTAMALACDQTRVVHYQLTKPITNARFDDVSDGHHQLTHNEPGEQPEVQEITRQVMEHFNNFLTALDAVPEADDTLLDHSLVLACSDISEGRTHTIENLPLIVAGGANGSIRMGEHFAYQARENVNHLSLSLLRAMGVNAPNWGTDATEVSTGLTEVEV